MRVSQPSSLLAAASSSRALQVQARCPAGQTWHQASPAEFFLQPAPWEKSDCSFTNFRAVTNGAESYLAQKAPGEALAGHARGTTSAWSKGVSSRFRLNWAVWETDFTPQAINPGAGGSQWAHLLMEIPACQVGQPRCLRQCCVLKATRFIAYIIQKSGL